MISAALQNQSQDIRHPLCVDCVCAPLSNYYAHEIPPPSLSPFATEGGRAPSSLLSATYAIYHSLDYLARSCSLLLSSPVKISISSFEPSFLVVLA